MYSGASGLECVDASFAVSAPRDHEYRLYSVLSIIAPPVNVLRRTRRKPSTIRGASPEVVIGRSAAARAGARPGARPYRCCIIAKPHGALEYLYQYDKDLIPARGRSSAPPALPDSSTYKTFACCCCYCCGCCQNTESRSTIMLLVLTTRLEQ